MLFAGYIASSHEAAAAAASGAGRPMRVQLNSHTRMATRRSSSAMSRPESCCRRASNRDCVSAGAITQIAWAVIHDVSDAGGNKFLRIQLDVVNPHEIWGESDPSAVGNVAAPSEPALAGW